jgi:hypothetical protein
MVMATPPAIHAAVPNCRTAQLALSLGRSEGAAGTIYYPIVFRNTSGSACALRGFPGVSSVGGDDGHQIGGAARRQLGRPARTVVLVPGAYGSAAYGQADALNYPKARCKPEHARGLRVYPPNAYAARYLPLAHLACSAPVGDSVIGRVVPGRSAT